MPHMKFTKGHLYGKFSAKSIHLTADRNYIIQSYQLHFIDYMSEL